MSIDPDPRAPDDSARARAGREHRYAWRRRLAERPGVELGYRILVALAGIAVLALGIVAIPYPGPGWAIVFAGLGILASEFAWAQRVLAWLRERYRQFMAWFSARGPLVRALAALGTFLIVVATLWVLDTFSLVGGWIGVEWPWLRSPLK
nr:TIGR02611 family protein [Nocardia harenae]